MGFQQTPNNQTGTSMYEMEAVLALVVVITLIGSMAQQRQWNKHFGDYEDDL